jgi:hypothetical protein
MKQRFAVFCPRCPTVHFHNIVQMCRTKITSARIILTITLFLDHFRPGHSRFGPTFRSSPSTAGRHLRLILAMVHTTPSKLVLKLSWDKTRPASSNFTLRNRKSPLDTIWQIGRVANRLGTFATI